MTKPQRPPKGSIRLVPHDRDAERALADWIDLNGFPHFIPQGTDLYLSRDGRTIYGERFLVKRDPVSIVRTSYAPPSWDYQVTADGTDLRRRRFAYPIVRPLPTHAPELARQLGLTKEDQ